MINPLPGVNDPQHWQIQGSQVILKPAAEVTEVEI